MKTLYLVRHAKSSWKFPELADFDRPLNQRGQRDAPQMGDRLRQQEITPDLILCSPAQRTRQTVQAIAQALAYDASHIRYEPTLYHATHLASLALLPSVSDQVRTLMMVGHNPGLTDLANCLTSHHIDNVVTAGVVAIRFAVPSWSKIQRNQQGEFLWYDYPKRIV